MPEQLFQFDFDELAVVMDDGREVGYGELGRMADAWAAGIGERALTADIPAGAL